MTKKQDEKPAVADEIVDGESVEAEDEGTDYYAAARRNAEEAGIDPDVLKEDGTFK